MPVMSGTGASLSVKGKEMLTQVGLGAGPHAGHLPLVSWRSLGSTKAPHISLVVISKDYGC